MYIIDHYLEPTHLAILILSITQSFLFVYAYKLNKDLIPKFMIIAAIILNFVIMGQQLDRLNAIDQNKNIRIRETQIKYNEPIEAIKE